MVGEFQEHQQIILQLVLAISVVSALIVAAMSKQRRVALSALRQSEYRMQQLIDAVPSPIWCVTPAGIPCYLNKRTMDVTGITLKDLIAPDQTRNLTVIHPDDRDAIDAAFARSFETGAPFVGRYRQRRANGSHRWVESRAEPLRDESGTIAQWYGVSVDIEDTMVAQEALKSREQELSQLVDMIPSLVWRLTPDGEPTFFNKRLTDFFGTAVTNIRKPGMTRLAALIEACVHPDDADAVSDALGNCLVTGEVFDMRYRLRRVDGVYRWMASRAEPTRDQAGQTVQWYGISHDIDDQVKAEEALRQSQLQLQQMVDTLPVRIWSATPVGEPLYFNKRYQDRFRALVPNFELLPGSDMGELVHQFIHAEDASEVARTLRRCFESGNGSVLRFRTLEKDGAPRWAECRVEPRRDESGGIVEWYAVSLDVDDEVRAQQALHERERELSLLVNMVPAFIGRHAPNGELTFFNKRLTDYLGLDVTDVDRPGVSRLSAMIKAVVHPEDADKLSETARRGFLSGEPFSQSCRLRRADGVYRWMKLRGEPFRDQNDVILQWYTAATDIDDEVRLYGEVQEREAKIRRLVDSDIIGIVIWDLDGRLIEANDAFLRLVQYEREDVQAGLRWLDMTPPEWREVHVREEVAELRATGRMQAREKEFFRKDGSRVRVLIGAANFEGQPTQGVAYILDLTERKRMEAERARVEEALRRSQLQLQQIVDTVPVQIWCVAPGGDQPYINKTMMDYTGLKPEDFDAAGGLAGAIQTLVHPDDRAALLAALSHSFRTGEAFASKFRNRRSDGAYHWQEGRAEPLRDENGRIIRWFGVNADIHDLVTAQEALRQRERSLSQLVEALPVMIDCSSPDGEPIYRSRQFREFLGYELEQLDGNGKSRLAGTLDEGVHPDDLADVKKAIARSLATGEPYAQIHRLRRFDGVYRWVDARGMPMRDAEGAIVQWNITCLDIDGEVRAQRKLRQAQERLAHASQLASLAELSASIAHEVNQPLTAIAANSHACQRWLTAEPPNLERAQKTVERIIRDANSAADVVSRIRALFKQSVETRASTSVATVIDEARNLMAEQAAKRRVRIDLDVASDLPLITLDQVQVQQVLINLMRNGIEAMDAAAGERSLGVRARRMDDAVQIEVSDRGPGVEFPDKMFEAFFTTKEQGMGMGLAISRSIIQSHGGQLWAEKNEPRGARFIFTIPIEPEAWV